MVQWWTLYFHRKGPRFNPQPENEWAKKEKENEQIKLSFVADKMTVYTENPKESTITLL